MEFYAFFNTFFYYIAVKEVYFIIYNLSKW